MQLYTPSYPAGIHSLPVELLTRIFILGAGYDYPYADSPFLLKPDHECYAIPSSNFQLLVSHVSQRWRQIALSTSSLWTTLHFREPNHLPRAKAYLARCSASATHLLDILVDTVSIADHIPGVNLCREEFNPVFDIIVPHVKRWRSFHLKVCDNDCKVKARQQLSTCGPAPYLETLQLYHFEDYRTVQNLYLATYRPPVMVFDNTLPRLRNVSLIGVNLPWSRSPYLIHLHCLELALHSDNIRPPYEYWDKMLRGSPELQRLSLHYSGPRVADGDPITVWPSAKEKIYLPSLAELSLTDLDPDYLCLLMERLVLPSVERLRLNLPDQDFTPFIELAAGVVEPDVALNDGNGTTPSNGTTSTITPTTPTTTTGPQVTSSLSLTSPTTSTSTSPTTSTTLGCLTHLPFPAVRKLSTLVVTALECSIDSWRALLRAVEDLQVLEMDFGRVGDGFYQVLGEGVELKETEDENETGVGVEEKDRWNEKGRETTTQCKRCAVPTPTPTPTPAPTVTPKRQPLLPRLHTFKISGLEGGKVRDLIRYREVECRWGEYGVKRWIVRCNKMYKERDGVLDVGGVGLVVGGELGGG
jgi:hypothetical protein